MKVKSESEVAQSCPSLSDPMDCSLPGSSVHRIFQSRVLEWVAIAFSYQLPSLLKFMPIESVMPSNHLICCCPLLLLPSIFLSNRVLVISRLFASGGQSIGASFSFNISPSSEHSGLILFWIYWFDLLAVLGTLKSLLQHHSSKASILCTQLYSPTLASTHDYWKNHSFDNRPLLAK